jgi:hypothetical protein
VIRTSRTGLCQIFKHCIDFPETELVKDKDLTYYLKTHSRPGAFNSRYNCITKQDVQREKELRGEIEGYIDKIQEFMLHNDQMVLNDHPATLVKTLIQRHIKAQIDKFEWAYKPARNNIFEFLTKYRAPILIASLGLIILLLTYIFFHKSLGWLLAIILGIAIIIDIIFLGIWALDMIMSHISRHRHLTAARPPDAYVRKIAATQLRPIINEMTAAAPLKKGRLRRLFYSTALGVINFARNHLMNVPTVSSIRWLTIDKRKRLVFLSNYSNTTDFYVREFLTGNTPRGVNFMFTNGAGFPDAELLQKGGISDDPEGYMNVIHTHQHVTDLWYSHDYNLTVDQIIRNRKIRNGLFKKMNEEKASIWLKLL